jgi:hypothetical protein
LEKTVAYFRERLRLDRPRSAPEREPGTGTGGLDERAAASGRSVE